MTEVIAPMSWLEMSPGPASPMPLLFAHPEDLLDECITAVVADIMGRFVRLTADAAALDRLDPRRA